MNRRTLWIAGWILLAVPALWQLWSLVHAVGGRFGYPYDLEWMEGGLLQHAQRISDNQGIYVAPSVDFIPYLYTPLYPGLIAFFGGAFGISYQIGRAISVLALIGIAWTAVASIANWRPELLALRAPAPSSASTAAARERSPAGPRWVGAAFAVGAFAASYPYVEGWYDLVRADTLFLFLITAGVVACAKWARVGYAGNGDAVMMAAAAILTLAFFTKQTGVIYVLWGGLVIVGSWIPHMGRRRGVLGALRRIGVYGLTAGVLGGGGVFLLNRITNGWFWTYIYKIHQVHDFNMKRFWDSFGHILWHFPALSIAILVVLIAVITTAILRPGRHGRLPEGCSGFLLWTATYLVSTLVGAIGFGTEFAHFNAYMPALLHGSLAFGAAMPAIAGVARVWLGERRHARDLAAGAAALIALVGGLTMLDARWDPTRFIPRDSDRTAGAALVKRISSIEGDVWIPSHPWYAHLAGKRMFVHRMGIKDVTARKPRPVIGLDEALREHWFAAVILDQRDVHQEVPGFTTTYRTDVALPGGERPRVYTGAPVIPEAVWIPAVKEKPPFGVRILFDFESGRWDGWETRGSAWGRSPASGAVTGQAVVGGFGGRFFATSMRGGDKAIGTLESDPFVIEGHKITLRIGGGVSDQLRVELRVDGRIVRTASPATASERLDEVTWDVSDLHDMTGQIQAIDDATGSWGHLNLDEIWLWP